MNPSRITTTAGELRGVLSRIQSENGRTERENLFVKLGSPAELLGRVTIEELEKVSR
jgi:hypothetical protein